MAKSEVASVQVMYRGAQAKPEAEQIFNGLKSAGIATAALSEKEETDVKLGAVEIVLILLITKALKAVAMTSLDYLENYFKSRTKSDSPDGKFQVVLQSPDAKLPRRFPGTNRELADKAAATFFADVRKAVSEMC